jgi:hypothetical protein
VLQHVKRHSVGYVALFVALGGTSFAIGHKGGGGVWTVPPASAVKPSQGNNCAIIGKELAHEKHLKLTVKQVKALAFCLEQAGQLTQKPGETTALQNLGNSMSGTPSAGTQLGNIGTLLKQNPNALNGQPGANGAPGIGGFSGVIRLPSQPGPGFTVFGAVAGASDAVGNPDTVQSTSPAVPMKISDLAVSLPTPPGGTNGITVAVVAKGVAQSLSCTIEAVDQTCNSPLGVPITIPANTPIVVQIGGGVATPPFPAENIKFAFIATQAS